MDQQESTVALPTVEVPMLEPEVARQIKSLRELGWGMKRIADELGVSRTSVRRYVRGGDAAMQQIRPRARRLTAEQVARAVELLVGPAGGNAVVAQRLLRAEGTEVELRTLQRALAPDRQARRAAELATVRYETAPGHQMQIDFGEKLVCIGGQQVKVHFFVAVLSYSRRLFVRASLRQCQDDWREGLAGAFRHFGGVPQTLLIDNAGALVVGRDREAGTVRLHPAFAAFCADWGVAVQACRPYRARTKGKTESGVGYVKHNAIAGLDFVSFAALEAHLAAWLVTADARIHGTTHERPSDRFERDERTALRPLPARPLPVRQQRVSRRVATDCFVDFATVRYSVPHRLIKRTVEVVVGEDAVVIYDGSDVVARHRRSSEPHSRVVEPSHFDGLWRPASAPTVVEPVLAPLGRTLDDYAAVVGGES